MSWFGRRLPRCGHGSGTRRRDYSHAGWTSRENGSLVRGVGRGSWLVDYSGSSNCMGCELMERSSILTAILLTRID